MNDIRYAARTLRRNRGFALSSIAVLALGIGGTTAMFTILNAVLLRPLPFPSPDRLAMLWSEAPSQNLREGRSAFWNVEQWKLRSKSFADLAVLDPATATLTTSERAERVRAARVSPSFFAVLGIQTAQGRLFTTEDATERRTLAVISHAFWQVHFGGSPKALGAELEIDGVRSQIIGILPASLRTAQFDRDIWQPHSMIPDWEAARAVRGAGQWMVFGRLRDDVTFAQAQQEMNSIARSLDDEAPAAQRNRGISIVPLSVQITGTTTRLALWTLTAAVFLVLLIAAGNAAGLALARNAGRRREMAIRIAIGAGRGQLLRQLVAESLLVALLSGTLGVLIAHGGVRLILALEPAALAGLNNLNQITVDARALGVTLAVCLFTAALVGLAPAMTILRRHSNTAGFEGGRGMSHGTGTQRARRALVVTEFALALVLLAGAGLLTRSLWSAGNVDPGFKPEQVLSLQISLPAGKTAAQQSAFYNAVLENVRSLPGVVNAGIIGDLIIGGNAEQSFTAEDAAQRSGVRLRFRRDEVSTSFFETVGSPLLKGRVFSEVDGAGTPPVAIVNQTMATALWPGQDAVGRRFKFGDIDARGPWFTVVGVSGDMRRQGFEREPLAQMFEPLEQNPSRLATLLVRGAGADPASLTGPIESAVQGIEKYALVYGVTTLEARLDGFLAERRFQSALLAAFSILALIMAAMGIYGLMQYSVAMRTREIGIRRAVGAQQLDVLRMIILDGLKLSLTGLVLGIAGALWITRAGSSLLFGVSASDPVSFLTAAVLLTTAALAACYFPARRAMKIEPVTALHQE